MYFQYQAYVKIEPINHLAVFIDTEAHLIPLINQSELEAENEGIITGCCHFITIHSYLATNIINTWFQLVL